MSADPWIRTDDGGTTNALLVLRCPVCGIVRNDEGGWRRLRCEDGHDPSPFECLLVRIDERWSEVATP